MIVKRRLMAGLAAALLSVGAGTFVATSPAQAAPMPCPLVDVKAFCLYPNQYWNVYPEWRSAGVTRNQCQVLNNEYLYNAVWNGTGLRWYLFHTTTCNGSHEEIAPGQIGDLPVGYDGGQTHAIMRTSSTS
jgi:hypothetical protein